MKELSRTNRELIEEISSLKRRVRELEQSESQRKKAEDMLLVPDSTLLEVLNSIDSLIYVVDMETYEIIFINRYGEKIWGDITGKICWQSLQEGKTGPCEFCTNSQLTGPDGNPTGGVVWEFKNTITKRWYDCRDMAIHWHDGRIVRLEIATDITERKQALEELLESESRIRAITDSAQDAILMMDPEGRISYWNPAAERILGYTNVEAIGQNLHRLIAPPHYHKAQRAAFPLFQQKGQGAAVGRTLDLEAIRKDGKEVPVQLSLSAIHMKGAWHAVGILRDITEQKQTEEKIRQMAYHDFLTGLPNRDLFSDRMGIALTQAQRNRKDVGIAMLDLDNFKGVNDTLGHAAGDLLLKEVAERLSATLRKGDTVARIGGDEFVLILPDLKGSEDAIRVAQKIVDGFRKPFFIDTHQLAVTTSIGIAVYPHDGTDEEILLKNADIAMYQAKEAGRDRYQLCQEA